MFFVLRLIKSPSGLSYPLVSDANSAMIFDGPPFSFKLDNSINNILAELASLSCIIVVNKVLAVDHINFQF